ncbi:MAG: hypothetical protein ACM33T_17655 [Solirubrobacterales bacterium]
MGWWPVALGVAALALAAVVRRSHLLAVLTLAGFLPLALYTLYRDFDRFWMLVALALTVLSAALVRAACRARPAECDLAVRPKSAREPA